MRFPDQNRSRNTARWCRCCHRANRFRNGGEFDQRVGAIAVSLEKQQQAVPAAILRSLSDMDGDFEMQAPAAGGSNGVLVPPWLYEGRIAVTNAAQSPFRNLYARGKVGASIAADVGTYRIAQSLYPRRSSSNCDTLFVNLDFRVAASDADNSGNSTTAGHRFWIGSYPSIACGRCSDFIRWSVFSKRVSQLSASETRNPMNGRTCNSGSICSLRRFRARSERPQRFHRLLTSRFPRTWPGTIDFAVLESSEASKRETAGNRIR